MVYQTDEISIASDPVTSVVQPLSIEEAKATFLAACSDSFDELVSLEQAPSQIRFTSLEHAADKNFRRLGLLLCELALRADPLVDPNQVFECPKCNHRMRIQNPQQRRSLDMSLGTLRYERPYCVCDRCEFTHAPLDTAAGIPARGPSVARRQLICDAAAGQRSFEKAQDVLATHSKITLSDESIRKIGESEGRRLVKQRDQRVRSCFQLQGHLPQPRIEAVPCIIVTCDGGRVRTRNPEDRWKENKIGCIYHADPRPDPNADSAEHYKGAKARAKNYVATMESWAAFGKMFCVEAYACGYEQAREKLFLSDGDPTLHELQELHFPDAVRILDWYHATQHLHDCGKAAFSPGSDAEKKWTKQTKDWLWQGKAQLVINAIDEQSKRLGTPPKKAVATDPRVVLHRNVGYFIHNQIAINYPTYRARGWPIGSGVAESSVKCFGLRVKGSEQFWGMSGVEEILQLCALKYSEDGRWHEYWRIRAKLTDEDAQIYDINYTLSDPDLAPTQLRSNSA